MTERISPAVIADIVDNADGTVGNGSRPNAAAARPHRRTQWTATDLMATEFPEPKWAVPGIMPEGLTFLGGPPKVGKSWMAYGLAVAVASGGIALGKVAVEPGDVLYLALEDPPRRLQDRLRKLLAGGPVPPRLYLWTECEPVNLGGGDQIRRWLDDHPDCRLVIADTLAKIRGPRGANATLYDTDYATGTIVKNIADERNIAVTLTHHTRKAAAEDFIEELSGTQGLAGAADTIAVLRRSRGSADASYKMTGRDVGEAAHAMNFAADLGAWQLLEGPASDYELSDERREILRAVRDSSVLAPKQIAEKSGVKYDVVRHLVLRMVDDGKLATDGAGHYFATEVDE